MDSFIALGRKLITNLTITLLFLLTDKHFLGFEMTANLRDTSPLSKHMFGDKNRTALGI